MANLDRLGKILQMFEFRVYNNIFGYSIFFSNLYCGLSIDRVYNVKRWKKKEIERFQ